MDQDDEFYYLEWGQAKYRKSVPYDPPTNVPILYTAALLGAYHVFSTTFEALKATFFQQEKVFQFPVRGHMVDEPNIAPEEFSAEENVCV